MRKEVVVRLDVDASTDDDYIKRYLEQMPFIYRAELMIYNAFGKLIPAPVVETSELRRINAETPSEQKWRAYEGRE